MNYGIDWGSAEVRGGTLSVALNGDLDFAFCKAFDMVLIESGSEPSDRWGAVQIAGEGIVVADVQPGAGDDRSGASHRRSHAASRRRLRLHTIRCSIVARAGPRAFHAAIAGSCGSRGPGVQRRRRGLRTRACPQ